MAPHSHGAGAHGPGTHGGSALHKVASFDVADHPVPTGREEDWRFTPLKRLRGLFDDAPGGAELAWTSTVPTGVEVTTIGTDAARALGIPAPVDRISALAVQHAGNALQVRVPAECELDQPVHVRLTGAGAGAGADQVARGHVVIEVGHHAKATVVLEHAGSARYAEAVSVLVGEGAALDLVELALWDDDAVHAGHTGVRVGRDGRFRSYQVTLGGDLVRLVETVSYDGPGGDAELVGLYFSDAGQHLEHRLFVDHAEPHCRSNVRYKGALQGRGARTVWIGDVLIQPTAIGTDTYELNRNLVLTDGARADSVPNLEIETGDVVGAGHASATGRFDDEQLFYLQARGIPADEARRLVVRGFFAELVNRIGVPELRERLHDEIERELAASQETQA